MVAQLMYCICKRKFVIIFSYSFNKDFVKEVSKFPYNNSWPAVKGLACTIEELLLLAW